jgi:hypothetical protein
MRTDKQTDRQTHNEANCNFSQFCENAQKRSKNRDIHIFIANNVYKKYKDLYTTIIEFHVARVQKKYHIRQVLVNHNVKWPDNATANVRVPAP